MTELFIFIAALVALIVAGISGAIMSRVAKQINEIESDTDTLTTKVRSAMDAINENAAIVNKNQQALVQTDELLCKRYQQHEDEIRAIGKRMDDIVESIRRIDADEKEIRSYYVNFRDPVPAAGVKWSHQYRCNDDDLTETLALVDGMEINHAENDA